MLKKALKALNNHQIIAVQTDTVPGLALNPQSIKALNDLYALKGRAENKPLISMVRHLEQVKQIANIPEWSMPILKKYWPGNLTVVFNALKTRNSGLNTIGIRIPAHDELLELLHHWGKELSVTSANLSGEPSLLTIKEIKQKFKHNIDCYYGSEKNSSQKPSTIIDVTGDKIKIIRQGELII